LINLKLLRIQHGYTLEQIAQRTGLTRSYLSKVERGLSTPSIESALSIAKVLGVRVDRLFGNNSDEESITITRSEKIKVNNLSGSMALVSGLTSGRFMRAFVIHPSSKGSRGRVMSHHEGEEILYVLEGKIELDIARRKEVLSKGDCAHFDSTVPHKLVSISERPSMVLVVIASSENESVG
jgi:transcriptional regulator with XRE-family HTH domain